MEFDFSENKTVETLDKVPEDFRGLYVETESGGYAINSEDGGVKSAVAAITKLSTTLKTERHKAKNRQGKVDLSSLADYGSTPEEIKEAVESKLKELTDELAKGGDAKLNLDKIKEDLAKAHAKDKQGLEKSKDALSSQLHKLLVENAATRAIAEHKGQSRFIMPLIKEQVKVVEEDGEFAVYVVDKSGDRRYSGVTGEPMTINELVKDMKTDKDYGGVFESESLSGGGTRPGSTSGKSLSRAKGHELSSTEKIAAGLAKKAR